MAAIMVARPTVCLTFIFFASAILGLAVQQPDEATIRRYSQQAEQALAEKNLGTAADALEHLSRLTPSVPEVFANLGMVYYTQGRYTQAAEAFQRALRLKPRMPNAQLMLGLSYAEMGQANDAIPILAPAFQRPPDREVGRTIGLKLVRAYASLDQHGKVMDVTEELLKRYPNDPEVLYNASHMYGNRALETMLRLVEVAPESSWKRLAFAEVHEAQRRYDLAIIEYRKVIKADPANPAVHYRLGRALLLNAKGNEDARDEARKEFEKVLALNPANAGAEYELGEIYRQRGQLAQAYQHFSRAVGINPRSEDARIALARSLVGLKNPQEAVPHLRAAIQLNPTNEVSHFLLAGAYKALGDTTGYQNETALFQKYHVRPYAGEPADKAEKPTALTTPEVTKQTLDSEMLRQP